MDVDGKHIVLTGAASGIGRAVLDLLANYASDILAVDLNEQGLITARKLLEDRPARIFTLSCDLSNPNAVDKLFEQATSVMGKVDIFIANAGFAYYEEIDEPEWKHIEKIFAVNVFNTLYTIEKMHHLYGNDEYKVVVTASAMAYLAVPGYALYSSTKAALHRFVDAYRWQLNDPRKLMLVYPIATRTGFFTAAGHQVPTAWPAQNPEIVARAMLRGILRDKLSVYPSLLFRLILILKPFLPVHWLEQWIEHRRLMRWRKKK